jgi:hypothetical protein
MAAPHFLHRARVREHDEGGTGRVVLYGTPLDALRRRRQNADIVGMVEVTTSELEDISDDDCVEGACGVRAGGTGVTPAQIRRSVELQVW